MLALQVRYATGAIRNISVEEVGKRIVKQIPNVLQQLAQLGSSADQVHALLRVGCSGSCRYNACSGLFFCY